MVVPVEGHVLDGMMGDLQATQAIHCNLPWCMQAHIEGHVADTCTVLIQTAQRCLTANVLWLMLTERLGTHPHDGASRDLEYAPKNKVMLLCDSDLPNAHRGVHAQYLLQQQPATPSLDFGMEEQKHQATACAWQTYRVLATSRSAYGVILMHSRCFSYVACHQ